MEEISVRDVEQTTRRLLLSKIANAPNAVQRNQAVNDYNSFAQALKLLNG